MYLFSQSCSTRTPCIRPGLDQQISEDSGHERPRQDAETIKSEVLVGLMLERQRSDEQTHREPYAAQYGHAVELPPGDAFARVPSSGEERVP